jgi:hypothetical protein
VQRYNMNIWQKLIRKERRIDLKVIGTFSDFIHVIEKYRSKF